MRIYTRKKKPKLYALLAIGGVLVAAAVSAYHFLRASGAPGAADGAFAGLLALLFLAVFSGLVLTLIRQMQYNPYSYNTILYFGFSLFVLSLLIPQSIAAYRCIALSELFDLRAAARLLLDSAKNYMRLSLVFIVLFSVSLAASNLTLIGKEGFRVQNALGVALAFLALGGEALIFLFAASDGTLGFLVGLFSFLYLYFECMLIGTIFASVFAARHIPEHNKDYVIILGCRVSETGAPTPLLRARADAALAFAREQERQCGKVCRFVASGGKGSDEPVSEAECIAGYLMQNGVAPERIVSEDRSTDTLENLRFSFALIENEAKCAFATTNFHVFRSGIAANRACKFKAEGLGAPTRWYFWPNAAVREFVGLLTGHRGKQALVLSSLVLCYLALWLALPLL